MNEDIKNTAYMTQLLGRLVQESGEAVSEMGACLSLGTEFRRDGRHTNYKRLCDELVDVTVTIEEFIRQVYQTTDIENVFINDSFYNERKIRRTTTIRMERIFHEAELEPVSKYKFQETIDFYLEMERIVLQEPFADRLWIKDWLDMHRAEAAENEHKGAIFEFFADMMDQAEEVPYLYRKISLKEYELYTEDMSSVWSTFCNVLGKMRHWAKTVKDKHQNLTFVINGDITYSYYTDSEGETAYILFDTWISRWVDVLTRLHDTHIRPVYFNGVTFTPEINTDMAAEDQSHGGLFGYNNTVEEPKEFLEGVWTIEHIEPYFEKEYPRADKQVSVLRTTFGTMKFINIKS